MVHRTAVLLALLLVSVGEVRGASVDAPAQAPPRPRYLPGKTGSSSASLCVACASVEADIDILPMLVLSLANSFYATVVEQQGPTGPRIEGESAPRIGIQTRRHSAGRLVDSITQSCWCMFPFHSSSSFSLYLSLFPATSTGLICGVSSNAPPPHAA